MGTSFMQQKYSLDSLFTHYIRDISTLRAVGSTPADITKIQIYTEAANTLKQISVKDIVQMVFAYAQGRVGLSGMKDSFLILIGYRIYQPSPVDIAYLKILLAYTKAFKQYRGNLKEWVLRFVLSSQFSPLKTFIDHEIADSF